MLSYSGRIDFDDRLAPVLVYACSSIGMKFKEYGFTYVTMDILGYRMGSMNETLGENDKTTADSSLKGKNE